MKLKNEALRMFLAAMALVLTAILSGPFMDQTNNDFIPKKSNDTIAQNITEIKNSKKVIKKNLKPKVAKNNKKKIKPEFAKLQDTDRIRR